MQSIKRFIARTSPNAASDFVHDLSEKMKWIADVEFTGVPRDTLSEGLRALPYRGRTIYFRTDAVNVRILRIMHQAQNVTPDDFA